MFFRNVVSNLSVSVFGLVMSASGFGVLVLEFYDLNSKIVCEEQKREGTLYNDSWASNV